MRIYLFYLFSLRIAQQFTLVPYIFSHMHNMRPNLILFFFCLFRIINHLALFSIIFFKRLYFFLSNELNKSNNYNLYLYKKKKHY